MISMWEDQNSIIWVPTSSNGLCSFDPNIEKFTRYPAQPHVPHALHTVTVAAIREDSKERLWVEILEGLSLLDRETGKFYEHDPTDSTTISANNIIWTIYEA